MTRVLALLALAACGTTSEPAAAGHPPVALASSFVTPGANAAGCYDPVDFGAIAGGDPAANRSAFQAAIDAAAAHAPATVCIPRGHWPLNRAPVGSRNRFAALSTNARDVELAGAGWDTVLEVGGDQGLGDTSVISIDPNAQRITVRDLAIDTTAMTNTAERTMGIVVGSGMCSNATPTAPSTCNPISDVRIERVRFTHPKRGEERKGDCIQLLGNEHAIDAQPDATPPVIGRNGTEIWRVAMLGNSFVDCARSVLGVQRGVHGFVFSSNTVHCSTCDNDIDQEATGGVPLNSDSVVIADNTFDDEPTTQGDFAIALNGSGSPLARISISGNTMNRGISLYRVGLASVLGNVIDLTARAATGAIELGNVTARTSVVGNVVSRSGVAGPVVRIVSRSGANSSNLVVLGNSLLQQTAGHGIEMQGVSNVSVMGNAIDWTVASPSAAGIYHRATTGAASGLLISGNRLTGAFGSGVYLYGSPGPISGAMVTGNLASGNTGPGLVCVGSGGVTGVTSSGNAMGSRSCTTTGAITSGD